MDDPTSLLHLDINCASVRTICSLWYSLSENPFLFGLVSPWTTPLSGKHATSRFAIQGGFSSFCCCFSVQKCASFWNTNRKRISIVKKSWRLNYILNGYEFQIALWPDWPDLNVLCRIFNKVHTTPMRNLPWLDKISLCRVCKIKSPLEMVHFCIVKTGINLYINT